MHAFVVTPENTLFLLGTENTKVQLTKVHVHTELCLCYMHMASRLICVAPLL